MVHGYMVMANEEGHSRVAMLRGEDTGGDGGPPTLEEEIRHPCRAVEEMGGMGGMRGCASGNTLINPVLTRPGFS